MSEGRRILKHRMNLLVELCSVCQGIHTVLEEFFWRHRRIHYFYFGTKDLVLGVVRKSSVFEGYLQVLFNVLLSVLLDFQQVDMDLSNELRKSVEVVLQHQAFKLVSCLLDALSLRMCILLAEDVTKLMVRSDDGSFSRWRVIEMLVLLATTSKNIVGLSHTGVRII